ncbi:hypothetical protein [Pararoseomonas baculiformis]|nr:hypothetical protein [Pararoseomonas baculiformis]
MPDSILIGLVVVAVAIVGLVVLQRMELRSVFKRRRGRADPPG